MNIFTSEQPMSKTGHFSAVGSLISFISLFVDQEMPISIQHEDVLL